MDSFTQADEEESRFFDALDHVTQEPSSFINPPPEYNVWVNAPQSVKERRRKFIRWMGLAPEEEEDDEEQEENPSDACEDSENDNFTGEIHRIMSNSNGGAVVSNSSSEQEFSSSRSSVSSWNTDDSDLSRLYKDFENISQLSCSVNRIRAENNYSNCFTPRTMDKLKTKWMGRWRAMTCMIKSSVKDYNLPPINLGRAQGRKKMSRIRVRHSQRKLKELSALYAEQDIRAHKGSILSMKFSPDGRYLASGGEDKILRVWKVIEDERSDAIDIPDEDSSCVYFSVNHLSELGPLMVEKDNKVNRFKSLKKTPDSACVIFPPKVFRIEEEPIHVFEGHRGDILDLSWSRDNYLLSSSVDKTVRLWRIGVDQCIKVFSHTDYVTCIQFNPVNDDNFISGSIDGKVRIWTIRGCQVVDWVEARDIISAISYRPDGQGGVIGTINGTCRFFSISDNQFQLETQMCLSSKKKSPCKRITSFQFLPQDPSKVLVTCADSQIRIIDGFNVIGKYKGLRNASNHISASFTSDGKHVISASEDSNIYVWNYNDAEQQTESTILQPKVNTSFECFPSDASIAIPWPGLKSSRLHETINSLPFSSSTCFSLSQEFLMDAGSKGSATWPEEKLHPLPGLKSPMGRSQYKLFRNSCRSSLGSHAWGLVIVTAEWDGRIRSFVNYGLPAPL